MVNTGLGEAGDAIRKSSLKNSQGVTYSEFRKGLSPRYGMVWAQILTGHLALIIVAVGIGLLQAQGMVWGVVGVLVGTPLIGYWLAYILLYFHEAAHWLIAPTKRANDLMADLFIGVLFGQSISGYRPVHFDHHRHLGEPGDSEHSYFDPLNLRFIVESLTGVRVLRVMLSRKDHSADQAKSSKQDKKEAKGQSGLMGLLRRWQLWGGLALNGGIVVGSMLAGFWSVAIAWGAGMLVFFPFFAAVRQVLEHRDFDADPKTDYAKEAHGALSRLFGDGAVSSTLGGAGFNRHLLHHYEPQISCTRLRDLERFLLDTELAQYVEDRRSTYYRTFCRLMQAG